MAKKKESGFGLDINLFSLIVTALAVVSAVIFFTFDIVGGTVDVVLTEIDWSISYLEIANGAKITIAGTTVSGEGYTLLWGACGAAILVAILGLLSKGFIKNLLTLILSVGAIIIIFMAIFDYNGNADRSIFEIMTTYTYINLACLAGIAGISIFKLAK